MKKTVFMCLLLSLFAVAPCLSKQIAVGTGDVCRLPEPPPDFVKYMDQMRDSFYRNLSTPVTRDVTIRFFLTSDGVIRDVLIQNSCGDKNVDLSCVDAAYCASPLAAPPYWRIPLPPAPQSGLLPPDAAGSGIYTFTFTQDKNASLNPTKEFDYLLIPKEVLFRYPGIFTSNELDGKSNKLQIVPTLGILENSRFQWVKFYKNNQHPSKEDIIHWSNEIADAYLKADAYMRTEGTTSRQ